MKTCYTCKINKELSEFGKDSRSIDKVKCQCKQCRKIEYDMNHSKILKQKRNDYHKHREKRLLKIKEKYVNNPEPRIERSKAYYNSHKQEVSEKSKIYRERNKEIIAKRKQEYQQKKRAEKLKELELFNSQLVTVNYPSTHKICTKCQSLKEIINSFNKKSGNSSQYRAACKECQSKDFSAYYKTNLNQIKNRDKEYRTTNSEEIKERRKISRQSESNKEWSKNYKSQIHVRIAEACRTRVREAVKNYNLNKIKYTIEYLGCDIEFLINYLESQFQPGMTWENYGEWHIDHRWPCCSFDLTQQESIHKCFHYTNLQPLWAQDNLSKSTQDKELSIYSL